MYVFYQNLNSVLVKQLAGLGVVPQTLPEKTLAGGLKYHISTWKVITKDAWITSTISGYQIEFTSLPHQVKRPHPIQYALDQRRLILEEVEELERKGVISELDKPKGGFYSNLFLVPKKDGG